MHINLTSRGIELDNWTEELIYKKLSKFDRFFGEGAEAHVTLTQDGSQQKIEITIPYKGYMLRTERSAHELSFTIDEAIAALERQMRKNRTRLEKKLKSSAFNGVPQDEEEKPEEFVPKLVRTKRFAVKPMDVEEAAMQMELVGHNFFVFTNADTNQMNVLYIRNDGNYGLIEPEFE